MASFSKTFDFNLRRDHQKNFLWASRLWVGRRKEPVLGYVPKNDDKKNSGGEGLTKIQEIQIRHWNTILYTAQKEASLTNLAQAEVALLYGATRPVVDLPIDDKHLPRDHPRVRSWEGDLHNASGTTETATTLRVIQREHGLKQTRSDDVAILSVSIIS